MSKILVIRMLEMGDVASIAVPTIRQLQRQNPQAEIYCLTHGLGADVVKLAAPSTKVLTLPNHEWPDNILQSLEAFLGLAETIIEIGFEQIINLDTAFMPCVLARFLKDAGEPVQGNYLSVPLQKLIEQIQNQSLLPEYVNNAGEYMHSTFMGMSRWHSQWWISDNLPDGGYPEYYLTRCCGFNSMPLDWHINVEPAQKYQNANRRIIYLALNDLQYPYPQLNELKTILQNNGYLVIQDDEQESLGLRLQGLKVSDLLVCLPNTMFSLATCVETPTLLIPGQLDPRILMPDYATDQADEFPTAKELAQSITSIFEAQENA
ncbi:glycosyltransferase family 9 protein [Aliiglaciecola sp. SL4]|uniref:glycosyltransferase family 9 protein n=1 Tax=Aliiglaciecola sp. SL4 TaxID=3239806 RepID=UPI00355B32C4